MRSIHFDVQGFSRTYWDLFVAVGFSLGFIYSRRFWRGTSAAFRQSLWQPCASLCGLSLFALAANHDCALEIPFCPPYRFFSLITAVLTAAAWRSAKPN
jgi:hypothetical protein